ncbi:MAG: hypothetical protein ACRDQD_13210, partial [Nocardioidaceae bacterium]
VTNCAYEISRAPMSFGLVGSQYRVKELDPAPSRAKPPAPVLTPPATCGGKGDSCPRDAG